MQASTYDWTKLGEQVKSYRCMRVSSRWSLRYKKLGEAGVLLKPHSPLGRK
jgi:hypothetical protein